MIPLSYAKLAAQNALLGAVVQALRAVVIDIDIKSKKFIVYFFYDGEINDELFDLASVAITEMSADLPEYELDDHIERLDFPSKIPIKGCLVYLRKE
jgi:hypothetical protein